MKPIELFKNFLRNIYHSSRMPIEIREGIANQSALINRKMTEMLNELKYQTAILKSGMNNQGAAAICIDDGFQAPPTSFEKAMQDHPLLFAPNTYNTSHPDYDVQVVRNFPGKIFNSNKDPSNPVYDQLKKLIRKEEIAEHQWSSILEKALAEAKTVPYANEVFERKAFIETYIKELEKKHGAFYRPGWVNLEDALFLYWVVRQLKPKTIVQAGVCNGLSSAFMMLALAKNGPDGTLHVVDMPPVFNSNDEHWKIKGKVYGVVIPEGKTSGWIVPDIYKDRFEVLNGDAKLLLPDLLKKVGSVDMFYHDSDHTYDHMMFEFKEAKKYLTPHGVMVADDISWNASLWDFADEYNVPAYNYRGSMGIACF